MDMPPSMPPANDVSRLYSVRAGIEEDRVVAGRSPAAGDVEALADPNGLHRLNAHQRLGDEAVELAVPVNVASQTDRHAVGHHLDRAAEGVPFLGGSFDLGDHGRLGRGVETPHR